MTHTRFIKNRAGILHLVYIPQGCVQSQINDDDDCSMGEKVKDKTSVDFATDSIGRTSFSEWEIDVRERSISHAYNGNN